MATSDIAVIEQYDPDQYEWFTIAFIGPDRTDGEIEVENADDNGQVRIRIKYLNQN